MYILGVNSVYHESSASILKDGKLIAAVEEERLNRKKHGKELRLDNPNELPLRSIEYCLKQAGITLKEVSHIGFSINPERRLSTYLIKDMVEEGNWGSEEGERFFYENTLKVEKQFRDMGFQGEFHFIDHHLCHGASSFFPSPFNEATVVVFDGIGETATTLSAYGKGHELKCIEENLYPSSLGFLWEKMSEYLGFSEYDACKVMGLAAYGDIDDYYIEAMRKILRNEGTGKFIVDGNIMRFRYKQDFSKLEEVFQTARRLPSDPLMDTHKKIARALQKVTEDVILNIVSDAYEKTGCRNLCLAGGVALNCVANRKILDSGLFDNLYIIPAPHDGGTSLGAAYMIWHALLSNTKRDRVEHAYWGPEYTDQEIEAALRKNELNYEIVPEIERKVAELIKEGNIVGWFQGAMELGPRALGNRSLLADPRYREMRERLNRVVKNREDFRPFAPSVLEEEATRFFEIPFLTNASDFMLVTYPAKEEVQHLIPAVIHVDGTSRIQIVKKKTNPRYYSLIQHFYRLTGIPMVLNTSFNDREPIVCSPEDAIHTFLRANIDYLAIGNYLVMNPNRSKENKRND